METSLPCSSSSAISSQVILQLSSRLPRAAGKTTPGRDGKKPPCVVVCRRSDEKGGRDHHYGGELVDENMIVLRKRIHEIRAAERLDEPTSTSPASSSSSGWMEWEKRYHETSYDSDVFEAVGLLQNFLMSTRPSVVLAMLALLVLSVPTSAFLVMLHVIWKF